MKAPALDYLRPATVAEALAALAENDGARVLAGGQSLMPMLAMRLVPGGLLVDIGALPDLKELRVVGDVVEIGAAVTQDELLAWPPLAARVPLLARALPHVGHFQTRNRGTFCGSVAHAEPSSEQPLVVATLGGGLVLESAGGTRVLRAADFFTGALSTARRRNELLTKVRVPVARPGEGFAFAEVSRRHGDFAVLAVAVAADARTIRIGIGGAADTPVVRTIAADTVGAALDSRLDALAWEIGGHDDIHATARYRRELIRRLGRKTIEEALACRA